MSVVIPAYNAAKYVIAALESVFAQTYKDYEVILVDDGSEDGTTDAIRPYLDRIRYIRQDNRGEAAARNVGVGHASGELIAFLDADDLWLPEKLEIQVDHLGRHARHALVFSDLKRFDDQAGVSDEHVLRSQYGGLPDGDILPYLFRDSVIASITAVVRKRCFALVGLFDERLPIGCDYDMWLRIAWSFEVGYIGRPLALYRQHASNVTRNVALGHECQLRVLRRFVAVHPGVRARIGATAVRRRLAMPSSELGRHFLGHGNPSEARRHLLAALRLWPFEPRHWAFFLATFLNPARREIALELARRWRKASCGALEKPLGL